MKKLIIVAALMALAGGTANAGETGIINQAGPYEATMRFYLHPAHGFPGAPEASQQTADASPPAKSGDASPRNARKPRSIGTLRTANEQRS
jgi:hypothetical protein